LQRHEWVIGMRNVLDANPWAISNVIMRETIRDSARCTGNGKNDILDFSKIEAGKLELDVTRVEMLICLNGGDVCHSSSRSRISTRVTSSSSLRLRSWEEIEYIVYYRYQCTAHCRGSCFSA